MKRWIVMAALVACTGCPSADSPKQVATLNLDSAGVPAPLRVGDRASLNLTLQRGEVAQLFGTGAFLADDSKQRLTEWHSEPAGAVRFDPETNEAVFEAAGDVQVWATWADDDGTPLQSNRLAFSVGDKAP